MSDALLSGNPDFDSTFDMEVQVIGGMLISDEAAREIVGFLMVSDFLVETHRIIFRSICDLLVTRDAVDVITLIEELKRTGAYVYIGGNEAIMEIMGAANDSSLAWATAIALTHARR